MKFSVEGQVKLVRKWAREKQEKTVKVLYTGFSILESWWKVTKPYAKKVTIYIVTKPTILLFLIRWIFLNDDDCDKPAMA